MNKKEIILSQICNHHFNWSTTWKALLTDSSSYFLKRGKWLYKIVYLNMVFGNSWPEHLIRKYKTLSLRKMKNFFWRFLLNQWKVSWSMVLINHNCFVDIASNTYCLMNQLITLSITIRKNIIIYRAFRRWAWVKPLFKRIIYLHLHKHVNFI